LSSATSRPPTRAIAARRAVLEARGRRAAEPHAHQRGHEPQGKDRLGAVRLADLLERKRRVEPADLRSQRKEQLAVRRMHIEEPLARAAVGFHVLAVRDLVEDDLPRRGQADEMGQGAHDQQQRHLPPNAYGRRHWHGQYHL
jgi:hypothetical protein